MAKVLSNKLAIVTGAARGIGAAVCKNLASKGANLVLGYTSSSSASRTEALAKELEAAHGIKTLIVAADMSTVDGPSEIVRRAQEHFGKDLRVDILINNAGSGGKSTLEESTPEEFERLYHINVRGPLLLTKAVQPYLPHDRSGRIVNLSSVSSSCGFTGDGIYGGTKAAIEAMTRCWARELAERATVNAVNPGPVATDMYWANPPEFQESMASWTRTAPLAAVRQHADTPEILEGAERAGGRPGYDHEVAGVIAMLCTPDSSWCTGSVICANGGMKFTV